MNGIPNLLRNYPRAVITSILGANLNSLIDYLFPAPNWGVFLPGTTTRAFDVSSVVEQDIMTDSAVSDYILETGSFATYNKVQMPNLFSIRLSKDGDEFARGEFLDWLDKSKNNLDVFDILCPERAYPNATLRSYRVSRSAQAGAARIIADCIFQEVREKPADYTNTRITNPENKEKTPTVRVGAAETLWGETPP